MSRRTAGTVLGAAIVILSGCATCERHPVACTAAVAVIGASIALSVDHHHGSHKGPAPQCTPNPATSFECYPIG